jgi:uncharacterized peroxidase-related enzyme
MMQRIPATEPARATGRTKEQLDAVKRKMGRVPNLHATLANSPAALNAYLCMKDALSHTTLDNRLRELVAIAVSSANDSEYCVSSHVDFARRLQVPDAELEAALDARSEDPKTRAALRFATLLVRQHGLVSDAEVASVKAAGFGNAAVLELVAAVALNVFTNYANHVAGTAVDFPRVDLDAARKVEAETEEERTPA